MKLNELVKKYGFHDSCPERIVYDKEAKTLTIQMTFSYWTLPGYDKKDPDTGPLTLVFRNVKSYEGPTGESDCWGISSQEIKVDGRLYFFMEDEIHDKMYDLYIDAESVDVIER